MSLWNFKCPNCSHSHDPDSYDLWECWNYPDDEFSFDCAKCGYEMTLKAKVDIEYEVCK